MRLLPRPGSWGKLRNLIQAQTQVGSPNFWSSDLFIFSQRPLVQDGGESWWLSGIPGRQRGLFNQLCTSGKKYDNSRAILRKKRRVVVKIVKSGAGAGQLLDMSLSHRPPGISPGGLPLLYLGAPFASCA